MRVAVIIIGLIIPLALTAQTRVGFNLGYGAYSMGDLKMFQQQQSGKLDVGAKMVSSFPAFLYVNGYATWDLNKLYIGGSVMMGSSGARTSYRDYSGSVTSDILVSYVSFGVPIGGVIYNHSPWEVTVELTPYYTLSFMKYREKEIIGSTTEYEIDESFHSQNISFQPAVAAARSVGRFGVFAKAGYHVSVVKGKLLLKSVDGAFLRDDFDHDVKVDWRGLRLEAGITFTFKRGGATSEE